MPLVIQADIAQNFVQLELSEGIVPCRVQLQTVTQMVRQVVTTNMVLAFVIRVSPVNGALIHVPRDSTDLAVLLNAHVSTEAPAIQILVVVDVRLVLLVHYVNMVS